MPTARLIVPSQSEQLAVALSYSVDIMGGSVSANVSHESYTTEASLMTTGDWRPPR